MWESGSIDKYNKMRQTATEAELRGHEIMYVEAYDIFVTQASSGEIENGSRGNLVSTGTEHAGLSVRFRLALVPPSSLFHFPHIRTVIFPFPSPKVADGTKITIP